MGFGKMNTFIEIITSTPTKDAEGFTVKGNTTLASVRAYMEERHGSKKWANMAAFSTASVLFRFRVIPGVGVDTTHIISCKGILYRIVSAEDVRGRGMYIEVMAERVLPSTN